MSVIMLMLLTSMIAPGNVKDPISADPSVLGKTKKYICIYKKEIFLVENEGGKHFRKYIKHFCGSLEILGVFVWGINHSLQILCCFYSI